MISVVIPAFDEERYLPATLDHLDRAVAHLAAGGGGAVEVVVVDNASTDGTAEVARACGARVVAVPERNIGLVRNAGARAAAGDVLVFLDADTLLPEHALARIAAAMARPACFGGAADLDHRPRRALIRLYLRAWRLVGLACGMAQGAVQFCRREAFDELGGYDESIFLGEDVDFFWRLRRLARSRGGDARILRDVRAIPSPRRFDRWPIRRILVESNPFFIARHQRRRDAWGGWHTDPPR